MIIVIFSALYAIFLYNYNNYYIKKFKNDFLYFFWGYIDTENKISAKDHLSLIIYHFFTLYELKSFKFLQRKYKFFPEDIKDMDPRSFIPNATKENLENFEKRHLKWIKFNLGSQYFICLSGLILIIVYMTFYI